MQRNFLAKFSVFFTAVAFPVEDLEGEAASTSLTISWDQPSRGAGLTTGYNLTCAPLLAGIPVPNSLLLAPTLTTTTVTGLYVGASYNCSVFTITDQGSSLPVTLSISTIETGIPFSYTFPIYLGNVYNFVCKRDLLTYKVIIMFLTLLLVEKLAIEVFMFIFLSAPSGAPEVFAADAGERLVNFSWSPLPLTQRVTSYTLTCSPSPSSLPHSSSLSQSGPLTVAGFSPNTHYSCSLVANNLWGSGPPATTTFTTDKDCKI